MNYFKIPFFITTSPFLALSLAEGLMGFPEASRYLCMPRYLLAFFQLFMHQQDQMLMAESLLLIPPPPTPHPIPQSIREHLNGLFKQYS